MFLLRVLNLRVLNLRDLRDLRGYVRLHDLCGYRETLNGSRDPLMAIASKPPRTGSPVPSLKKSIDQNALVAK